MFVKPEIEKFAKIRVVGVGGGGGNVLNTMIESQQIQGVEFIAVNTDAQALSINKAAIKIPIGQNLTKGLGAGATPDVGEAAAKESLDEIKSHLEGSDMVFVTACMGGGTGTGASPSIAALAKDLGALTIGVVTKPFNFEGAQRMANAERGIANLKKEVDALITIPNQKLIEIADEKMSILEAFKVSDSVLHQGVQGISDLIVMPGLINVDFADVRTIMESAGSALMGIGIGTGENRAEMAAKAAINSPLLDVDIEGATGVLFNVIGGMDLSMKEVDVAAKIINEATAVDANIIFGTSIDHTMSDQIKITVIATGFDGMEEGDIRTQLGMRERTAFARPVIEEDDEQELEEVKEDLSGEAIPAAIPEGQTSFEVTTPAYGEENDNLESEEDKKYDIPAFLRGK